MLQELIANVHARPAGLSHASAGRASLNHPSMALLLKGAGLEMTHVAYTGNAPARADVISGHIPVMFSNLSGVLPHQADGSIRLIAVSSEQRSARIPDVPTVSESGYREFKTQTCNGLMAPVGPPRDVLECLAQEIAGAVNDADLVARPIGCGVDPLGGSPERFAAMIGADVAFWAKAVAVAGIGRD